MSRQKLIEIIWLVVIIALFVFSIKLVRSGELQSQISSFGIWAPIVFIILKMSTLVIAPLGGSPLYFVAGAVFGNLNGFILSLAGDVLGSIACFAIGRKYGARVVKIFVSERYFKEVEKAIGILANAKSFLKARLGFASIPELLAYAAGLSKIKFIKFVFWHNIFYIPIDLALVFLGSQIASLSVRYFFIFPVLVFLAAVVGFLSLYKDYESRDEILRGEKTKETRV